MSRVECRTRQVDACGTKSTVGNVPAPIQELRNKSISRLHTDRDVCKESTDTSKEATQGCSATLNPVMAPKSAPMATCEDGQRQKRNARGTSYPSDRRGCQMYALLRNAMCSSASLAAVIAIGLYSYAIACLPFLYSASFLSIIVIVALSTVMAKLALSPSFCE